MNSEDKQHSADADAIRSVIIIGGGTSGWMCAAAMAATLGSTGLKIRLIESEAIGTVGVGEATLPHIRFFNAKLGIDEAELMAATQATFKLGIEFKDWGKLGDSYIHPFGDFGWKQGDIPFHQFITRGAHSGLDVHLDDFSVPVKAAREARFTPPHTDPNDLRSTFGYAYQFDAGLYAKYLRKFCEDRGVERIEGRITNVNLRDTDGFIEAVQLENGHMLEADLFVDCSGFRALLMGQAMGIEYNDWTDYLPCNRAVTAACEHVGTRLPYTRATAKSAGWQWRIPLQHRTGNGYVYCDEFISDDEATASLLADLEGPQRTEPKLLRFKTGQRKKSWVKNCVAVGLSGGFLEPLESTGIYLIQEAITNLIELFPTRACEQADVAEYNRLMDLNFERVRDFLLLHYVATTRDDSAFWRRCRDMELPDSLKYKMDLFQSSGRVVSYEVGAFKDPSWLAVYFGQNIIPRTADPASNQFNDNVLGDMLGAVRADVAKAAGQLSDHQAFIDQYCKAG